MAPITVGETIPDVNLAYLDDSQTKQDVSLHSLAVGKLVVIVAVPGAYTPTCSLKHVPGFIEKAEELKSKGVAEIICISVNDHFVMKEWSKTFPENKHVKFLADGSAAFARAVGLEVDLSDYGFGKRSHRYALLLDDLKVKVANIEALGEFSVSTVDEILKAL
ncbi:unnamed protein product [Amaranthus hypochondriacus]